MTSTRWTMAALLVTAVWLGGCDAATPKAQTGEVPYPASLLLPREVKIHPFTGTRTFDESGGVRGIEARVEAINAFGDASNAFGTFHFELYSFRADSADPKGKLINTWEQSVMDAQTNRLHWDHITRSYVFRLQWYKGIPVGHRFVLAVSFSSPYTERLYAEHVFVSGQ